MMNRRVVALALMLALAGCGKAERGAQGETAAAPARLSATGDVKMEDAKTVAVSVPQIAYSYHYGFRLSPEAVAATQDRHIALCDRLGSGRCRVLGMTRVAGDSEPDGASLKLVVAAPLARGFGRSLASAVMEAGGTTGDSTIEAEDLSKRIVDTEARLRAKQALADRLMALLKTRAGPVSDLVAAERGVADVQEEIDAASSWLAEARGRVEMSAVEIAYASGGTFGGTLGASSQGLVALFVGSLRMLALVIATLLPWAVAGGAILLAMRAIRQRHAGRSED